MLHNWDPYGVPDVTSSAAWPGDNVVIEHAIIYFGNLTITGNADIVGVNIGGAIGFNSLSMANSSTTIQCVNNSCNYNSTTGPPPNPLDLVTGMQVLPVELLDFQAVLKENTALLSWTTATEANNDYFLLEHSADGKQFSTIAIIPGVGNSTTPVSYEYLHDKMTSGNNYYRLWQYDYDGSSTILGLRQLRTHPSTFTLAGISPNPGSAGQSLRLELPTNTHNIEVHLVNSSGQSWSLPFADGAQQVTLPSTLPSGMYYLRVQHRDQAQTIPVAIIGQ